MSKLKKRRSPSNVVSVSFFFRKHELKYYEIYENFNGLKIQGLRNFLVMLEKFMNTL